MLADVVLPSRRFQVFTYLVPAHLEASIHIGSSVTVPLGSTVISGLVANIYDHESLVPQNKPVRYTSLRAILTVETETSQVPLGRNLFRIAEKISAYYLVPLSTCLRLIVPPYSVKMSKRLLLTEEGRAALGKSSLSKTSKAVLRKLEHMPNGLLRSSMTRSINDAAATLAFVKKKGWVVEKTASHSHSRGRKHPRPSRAKFETPNLFDFLNQGDKSFEEASIETGSFVDASFPFWSTMARAIRDGGFQEVSVVGAESVRRKLLLETIKTTNKQGKQALILMPEVHQAETLADDLQTIWKDQVEVYHGQLSSSVRSERWERIHQGETSIIVGTRSALFLPLVELGLVWVEEEQDASYKDEHLPYYHAREVARMRGEIDRALVVYGATCPSLECYSRFPLPNSEHAEPFNTQVLHEDKTKVEMIDLGSLPFGTTLAPQLMMSVRRTLEAGQQIILLLNRKGFSRALICQDCGQAPKCLNCGVTFTLFHRPARLVCSYCDNKQETPEICPSCQGAIFRHSGMGTQRLEEELAELVPSYSIARLDRENVKTMEEANRILQQFRQQKIQILIGTEFLLHRAVPPTAPLVIFPQADLGLHIPDFRSSERTFQMLSKAVALAQNEHQLGQVILQTRMPDHHVHQAIYHGDPRIFYAQELELREALGYPPATHVILLVITGAQAFRVQRVVDFLDEQLKGVAGHVSSSKGSQIMLEPTLVLGPLDSRKPRQRKKHRTIFLLKTFHLEETQQRLREIRQEYNKLFSREPIVFEVNVDPIEIQ